MKLYREYMVLLLKSIINASIAFVCFYAFFIMFFGIYHDEVFFLTGAGVGAVSAFFHGIMAAKHTEGIQGRWSYTLGTLFSAAVSGIFLLYRCDIIHVAAVFLYSILLWKLGADASKIGTRYDIYRYHFIAGIRILLIPVIASLLLGSDKAITTAGRYSIIYIVLGWMLLRNSRKLMYFKTGKSIRPEIFSIISNAVVLVFMLLITSNSITMFIIMAAGKVIVLLDKGLVSISYIITYPIGYLLTFIINLLRKILKVQSPDIELNEWEQSIDNQLPEDYGWDIPYWMQAAMKIIVAAAIVYIIIRVYRKFLKSNKAREDYSETREYIVNLNSFGSNIKDKLLSFGGKFRRVNKPVTLTDRIRGIYNNFLELNIKHGVYRKRYETHREIENNSMQYAGSADDIKALTDIYEKTRYGSRPPDEGDYSTVQKNLKSIEDMYSGKGSRK